MAQFYFLSIMLNIFAGLILVYGIDLTKKNDDTTLKVTDNTNPNTEETSSEDNAGEEKKQNENKSVFSTSETFSNRNFRLVTGVLSVLVAIMKLLSVFRNDVPVLGDLLPAVAGFLGGASLLIEYYLVTSNMKPDLPAKIEGLLIDGRKYIGILCIAAAVLHFIFPQVLFL